MDPDFRVVLNALIHLFEELYQRSDTAYKIQILFIKIVIKNASQSVQDMNLDDTDDWLRIINVVRRYNRHIEFLAEFTPDSRMRMICNSLADKSESSKWDSLMDYSPINAMMLRFLANSGDKLAALLEQNTNFYSFLGGNAPRLMHSIINLLSNVK